MTTNKVISDHQN